MSRTWSLLFLSLMLTGCATHRVPLYTWGHYEGQIYTSYSEPGKLSQQQQIEELEQDYQKARASNKRMHPGFHAQLGYLYFQTGKLDQARQEFATEKAEFPESAVLMDRLTANLAKK